MRACGYYPVAVEREDSRKGGIRGRGWFGSVGVRGRLSEGQNSEM